MVRPSKIFLLKTQKNRKSKNPKKPEKLKIQKTRKTKNQKEEERGQGRRVLGDALNGPKAGS